MVGINRCLKMINYKLFQFLSLTKQKLSEISSQQNVGFLKSNSLTGFGVSRHNGGLV